MRLKKGILISRDYFMRVTLFVCVAVSLSACSNGEMRWENFTAAVRGVVVPATPSNRIEILGGVSTTSATSVDLVLYSSNYQSQMYLTRDPSCTSLGGWEPYSTAKSGWYLAPNSTNNIYATFQDTSGAQSPCVSVSISQDSISPVVSFTSPTSSTEINTTGQSAVPVTGTCEGNLSLTFSGSTTGSTPCTSGSFATILDFSLASDGPLNLTATQVDSAGNSGAGTVAFTKDTGAPHLASATITNSSPTRFTIYNLTYGTVTGAYTTYCILENSTTVGSCSWTSGTLPTSYIVTAAEEAKVLSVWMKDSAGNVSGRIDTNSVTLDTTAPVLASATVSNSNPTNSSTYNLTYGSVTGTYTSYCILENSTVLASCMWNSGTLPSTFSVGSTENSKALSLWIKDAAGNVSPRVDTNAVTLKTSLPVLASLTILNPSPTNTNTYSLSYGAITGTFTSYCILENSTLVASCSWTVAGTLPSTFSVSNTENTKMLSVWLKDAAGNISTRVDSNSITLDKTIPVLASVTITNPNPTNSRNYNLTYGATSESYSAYCILENSTLIAGCTWLSGSLPAAYTVTNVSGGKVLTVWLRDAAGNFSAATSSNSVTLDLTSPSLASASIINTTPTNTQTFGLSYGSITGSYTSYCILENDTTLGNCTFVTATLPTTYTVSPSENSKTLSIWLKSAAGNISTTRVDTNAVTYDGTSPVLASAAVTNSSPTNSTTYNLTFGAVSEAYGTYCILENNTVVTNCTFTSGLLPAVFTVSATDNSKTLSVWVRDLAGNTSARVDSNSVALDKTAPILASATIADSDPTTDPNFSLTYGAVTGSYSDYCILENNTILSNCIFINGTLPANFTVNNTSGSKTLSLWLKDNAGNISNRVDSNSITLNVLPVSLASVTITNSNPTSYTTYNLTYGSASVFSDYCILENDTNVLNCGWITGSLPASFSVSATQNAKVLSVWIKNGGGTVSSRVASNSVTLDTTSPQLASATITDSSPTNSTSYHLTFGTVTDTFSNYCILENDTTIGNCTWTAGSLPTTYTVTGTDEAKVLSFWLKDAAGNLSTRVDTNSVSLDATAPILASASVTNPNPTNSLSYTLSYGTVTGSYTHYCIKENNTTLASCSFLAGALPGSFTVTNTDGPKVLSIWLKDSATNMSVRVDTNSVSLLRTPPILASMTITNPNPTNSQTYNLSYGLINGIYTSYCIRENNISAAGCTYTAGVLPATFPVSAIENAKVLSLWLKDAAGNVSARIDSNSVTLDLSAPVLATANISNSNPTNSRIYSLVFGSITGTYSDYCILENSGTIGSCSWNSGTLPTSYTVSTTENAKVLSIWLRDSAGNTSALVSTNSVTLDTTPPVLASAAVSNSSPTNSTTYNLTYGSITDTYSSYCILENLTTAGSCSWNAGTLPNTFVVPSTENAKILSIWLKDSAGNISATRVDTNSVTLDLTPPILASATVTNANPTKNTTYSLSYGSITGAYQSYCIRENDTILANCTFLPGSVPSSFLVSATNNVKIISIWLKDLAGNISTARVDTNAVTLDTVAPTLAISTPSSNNITISTGTTTFTVNYNGASSVNLTPTDISLSLTGGTSCNKSVTNGTTNSPTVTLSNCTSIGGTIVINISSGTAVDNAGNSALGAGPSGTVTVVAGAPTLAYAGSYSLTNGTPATISPSSLSDNGAAITSCTATFLPTGLSVNNSTCVISGTPITITASANYTVTVTNSAGSTNATVNISVNAPAPDTTAPVAATSLYWQETPPHTSRTITAMWTKSASYVAGDLTTLKTQDLYIYLDAGCAGSPVFTAAGLGPTVESYAFTAINGANNGETYSFKIIGKDEAGNTSAATCTAAGFELKIQALNIEVPIELIDAAIGLSTAATAPNTVNFLSSLTPVDFPAYDGTSVTYSFEVVVTNNDTINTRTVALNDGSFTVATIPVGPNKTMTRIRVGLDFNGATAGIGAIPSGKVAYNIALSKSDSAATALTVHSARIIINQVGATKTKVYVPLLSDNYQMVRDELGGTLQYILKGTATSGVNDGVYANSSTNPGGNFLQNWLTDVPSNSLLSMLAVANGPGQIELWGFNATASTDITAVGNRNSRLGSASFVLPFTTFAMKETPAETLTSYPIYRAQINGGSTALLHKAGLWIAATKVNIIPVYYRTSGMVKFTSATAFEFPQQRAKVPVYSPALSPHDAYYNHCLLIPTSTSGGSITAELRGTPIDSANSTYAVSPTATPWTTPWNTVGTISPIAVQLGHGCASWPLTLTDGDNVFGKAISGNSSAAISTGSFLKMIYRVP